MRVALSVLTFYMFALGVHKSCETETARQRERERERKRMKRI